MSTGHGGTGIHLKKFQGHCQTIIPSTKAYPSKYFTKVHHNILLTKGQKKRAKR